jgi:hypothetical protein
MFLDGKGALRPRALVPADLEWQFQDAEAALGIRSTLGAFVDMALAGPPASGGGRSNGVEAAAVEQRRLDATGRHRCIRARLSDVARGAMRTLEVAFGAADWARIIADPDLRHAIEQALAGVPVEVAKILPLTGQALAHAERRQAPGYRAPPAKRHRFSELGHTPSPAEHLRRHLAHEPGLAGTAVGHVLAVLLGGDQGARTGLLVAGRMLLEEARAAAGVTDPPRQARTRSVQLLPRPCVEPADPSSDSEAFAWT